MKHVLFSLLFLISSTVFSQAVTIAATEGGSVTLTPDGVVRTQPTAATKALLDKTKAAKKNVAVPVVKPPLESFEFKNIGLAEARMVFRAYTGVRDDENASADDIKTADALRKFIIENKGFANSTKKITVIVSAARIERVFGSSYANRSELQRELRQLDIEEGLFKQVAKQEELAGILDENSVLRNQKDKFK